MPSLADISEKIESLQHLLKREVVFMDDIPKEFRIDLQNFIVGQTMTILGGRIVIGKPLLKQWLDKIRTSGFDYEIDFKQ
jgi:hypothetical protein